MVVPGVQGIGCTSSDVYRCLAEGAIRNHGLPERMRGQCTRPMAQVKPIVNVSPAAAVCACAGTSRGYAAHRP